MDILELLAGPATGLLGSTVGRVVGLFEGRQRRRERDAERAHELLLLDKQRELRASEREHEVELAAEASSLQLRQASYQHGISIGETYEWVNAVRALVRPVLTVALIALCSWSFYITREDPGSRDAMIETITFLTLTCITWWFGDRAPKRGAA